MYVPHCTTGTLCVSQNTVLDYLSCVLAALLIVNTTVQSVLQPISYCVCWGRQEGWHYARTASMLKRFTACLQVKEWVGSKWVKVPIGKVMQEVERMATEYSEK